MSISLELLDALELFDQETAPLGLYACEEYKAKETPFPRLHQEWHLCLKPKLESLGYQTGSTHFRNFQDGKFAFHLPQGTLVDLTVVRTSKIKVRKFGSAYRIDPHHNYQERWEALQLAQMLRDLWRPSELAELRKRTHLVIFIGFAAETEPFAQELSRLEEQLNWNKKGVLYTTRSWADKYSRHFYVRLSAWMIPANSTQSPTR